MRKLSLLSNIAVLSLFTGSIVAFEFGRTELMTDLAIAATLVAFVHLAMKLKRAVQHYRLKN